MPEITLSLPAALGMLIFLLAIGAGLVYFLLVRGKDTPAAAAAEATLTPTASTTPTVTMTAAPTSTSTPEPTWTPLPPLSHTVAAGESCLLLANYYSTSVKSIIDANGLDVNCTLTLGKVLSIPQPTPTASPQPTSTASEEEVAEQGCTDVVDYEVKEGDSLMGIASNYNVAIQVIKDFNGLVNDNVFIGNKIKIPLCERKPLDGSTPTPTKAPDYAAANLLLPANGASFTASDQTITLQWSSVGTLRENEAYAVTVEDLTAESINGEPRRIVEYVTDTKFILPDSIRPKDNTPHMLLWSVVPVRQVGTTQDGTPIWEPAGPVSEKRGLIWVSSGGPAPATTTQP